MKEREGQEEEKERKFTTNQSKWPQTHINRKGEMEGVQGKMIASKKEGNIFKKERGKNPLKYIL